MTDGQKQSKRSFAKYAIGWVVLFALLSTGGVMAAAEAIRFADGASPEAAAEPASIIWRILLGGFVLFSFATALILWGLSALHKARILETRREFFVTSALNNLTQGIVILNARQEVAYCNDRYLQLYGLSRADLFKGMTGRDLLGLRAERGTYTGSIDGYSKGQIEAEGHVWNLVNGRSISVKRRSLANGGIISTHEDCTEQRALSAQLATAKNFLESVIDNIPVSVVAKNIEDGRFILANRAFEEFSGLPRERIIGYTDNDLYSEDVAAVIKANDRKAIAAPDQRLHAECTFDLGHGPRMLSSNRIVVRNANNEPEFLIAMFEDVTGRRSLSQEIQNTKKFLELVVDNIPAALLVQRISDGKFVLANRGAETILNRRREEIIDHTVEDVHPEAAVKFVAMRDDAAIKKGGLVTEEHPIPTDDGLRLFATRRVTVTDESGAPQYLIKTSEDITDRRETESRMAHMAYHDTLTGMPNRVAFQKALEQLIDACSGTAEEFAVFSVDLDRFKEVNDVFGHETGDKLLIEVSKRIEAAAEGGVVARLGGDEYGLIIDGNQPEAARRLAGRLAKAIGDEFVIDGKILRIGLTMGISIFPHNGTDGAALLANADAALFRAKAKARGSVSFYEAEMDQQIRNRRALHQDLSAAIRNGELSLHYQPQAYARHKITGDDVVGFEALARWVHPMRGFVPPSDFIPLAEESGLIVEMGEWILREACREATSWPRHLQIAVNLSPAQFAHGDLVGLVHSILLETGLTPGRLELEITEGVLIDDFDRGLSLLRRLKALGVRIAMDDFGSGYSSLTYLQAFPFDKIKIDRAFVMNLGRNSQSAAIIRAMIGLGHGLDISIVAEGVETLHQLSFLTVEGCDQVQGYFLGKPAPISQYGEWIGRAGAVSQELIRKIS
ncbi:MAG: EAL domain-containing protein [Bradyrhizobiaceae bacterium]|nr:MAG: EAL domain-containing protein [Bradyrhizobiaceae bacterium]